MLHDLDFSALSRSKPAEKLALQSFIIARWAFGNPNLSEVLYCMPWTGLGNPKLMYRYDRIEIIIRRVGQMPSKAPTSRPKHEIYLAERLPQTSCFQLDPTALFKSHRFHTWRQVKLTLATTDSTHPEQLAQPFWSSPSSDSSPCDPPSQLPHSPHLFRTNRPSRQPGPGQRWSTQSKRGKIHALANEYEQARILVINYINRVFWNIGQF